MPPAACNPRLARCPQPLDLAPHGLRAPRSSLAGDRLTTSLLGPHFLWLSVEMQQTHGTEQTREEALCLSELPVPVVHGPLRFKSGNPNHTGEVGA